MTSGAVKELQGIEVQVPASLLEDQFALLRDELQAQLAICCATTCLPCENEGIEASD